MSFGFLFSIIFVLSFSAQAHVVFEGEDAGEAFASQDFEENLDKAEEGDVRAQVLVGAAYLFGLNEQDVEVNYEEGLYWLSEAASQGVAEAHYELGRMYCRGMGVEKSSAKCETHLARASELGLNSATMDLMDIYQAGDAELGIGQDEKKYLYWLERSAENGAAISMRNMAHRYRKGRGLELNVDKAFEWIMRAVGTGDPISYRRAAEYFENGWGTEQDLVKAYMLYDQASPAANADKARVAEQMTEEQVKEAIARSWQLQRENEVVRPASDGYRYQPDVSDLEPLSLTPELDQ